mmetsp:Transcript_43098/g.48917  ORF Transcript_43098/g.48917 Transcript_43098/m.48917 type:complete len:182 (+) Transcript_43098:71-616(+)|eukprot:CAMPEP_0194159172 /NCGR_PEP_ID=MMETSP0152-20130528/77681_1 /TAXON_ID=1049557 /ORGANISM="Thalassiothrix antarctica, Strain L6-D1" /LENGTH=181 /DNA_ID=CAMNT_0038868705 /DNA_START=71 /DNA_END=616 /DNA_ORIENTATION=+
MLSRFALSTRTISRVAVTRNFVTVEKATADDALNLSGYKTIDYTINEDATVFDAIKKFAAFNIGCLVTVNETGTMTGIFSERDYISKIALLGRTSKDTSVKEISTKSGNLVTASLDESVEDCMTKMLSKDVRHLPLLGKDDTVVGMISIKDLVRTVVQEKEKTIRVLSDFALGKGGHYGSE